MPLHFSRPLLLAPGLLLGALALLRIRGRGYYSRIRVAAMTLARAVAVAALALLAGGIAWVPGDGRLNLVVLEDVSASMDSARRAVARGFLAELRASLPKGDTLSVVRFAGRPARERVGGTATHKAEPSLDPKSTDLEGALRVGMACAAADARNRIVVLSDGEENRGRSQRALPELQRRQIPLFALDLGGLPRAGFELRSVTAPSRLFPGEPFSVKGLVAAGSAGRVTVRLFRDGVAFAPREVAFTVAEEKEVEFSQESGKPGRFRFRMELLGAGAGDGETPAAAREIDVEVLAPPRVLYLTEDEEAGAGLRRVLRSAGLTVETASPANWNSAAFAPAPGGVIVLDDVGAATLGTDGMARIEGLVRERGVGLLVLGGRHSFGAGGYRDTALERTLPTVMGAPGKGPEAQIGLVLVVDASFSMYSMGRSGNLVRGSTPRKIEIAKLAVLEVLRALRPGDRAGVLQSKDELTWILRPGDQRPAMADLEGRVNAIKALGGGINFYSSVLEASRELKGAENPLRLIMVVCDTNDIDQYRVENVGESADLVRNLAREGISLSIFAIGFPTDKDVPFLRTMATLGRGDFFLVTDLISLPRYLRAEYEKKAGEWFREGELQPLVREESSLLEGVNAAVLPPVLGVDLLTTKMGASEVLATPLGTAFLSLWNYGGGKTAVFASDSGSRWAASWTRWLDAEKFWRQLIYRIAPRPAAPSAEARVETDGENGRVVFRLHGRGGIPDRGYSAVTLERGAARSVVPLTRLGLETYGAALSPGVADGFTFRIAPPPGIAGEEISGTLDNPPSAEGRIRADGSALLGELARESGGTLVSSPAEIVAGGVHPAGPRPDLVFWLLLGALVALLAEFLVRYD